MVRLTSRAYSMRWAPLTSPLVTQQLNDGVRMLQVQAHTKGTTIQLCHTSCVRLLYDYYLVPSDHVSPFRIFSMVEVCSTTSVKVCMLVYPTLASHLPTPISHSKNMDGRQPPRRYTPPTPPSLSSPTHIPLSVVSMLIVNIRNQPPTAFSSIFTQAGLADLAYTPVAPSVAVADWPTLGSMIESGKRLVIFMDNQAQYDVVSWIIDGQ